MRCFFLRLLLSFGQTVECPGSLRLAQAGRELETQPSRSLQGPRGSGRIPLDTPPVNGLGPHAEHLRQGATELAEDRHPEAGGPILRPERTR
jgi:hypothetical protein